MLSDEEEVYFDDVDLDVVVEFIEVDFDDLDFEYVKDFILL